MVNPDGKLEKIKKGIRQLKIEMGAIISQWSPDEKLDILDELIKDYIEIDFLPAQTQDDKVKKLYQLAEFFRNSLINVSIGNELERLDSNRWFLNIIGQDNFNTLCNAIINVEAKQPPLKSGDEWEFFYQQLKLMHQANSNFEKEGFLAKFLFWQQKKEEKRELMTGFKKLAKEVPKGSEKMKGIVESYFSNDFLKNLNQHRYINVTDDLTDSIKDILYYLNIKNVETLNDLRDFFREDRKDSLPMNIKKFYELDTYQQRLENMEDDRDIPEFY